MENMTEILLAKTILASLDGLGNCPHDIIMGHHATFILPSEYVSELNKNCVELISYKTQCSCGKELNL
jgi:hypothetical protein